LICYLALTIWFSEVMRMLRAGAFLVTVEKRLDTCGDGSLGWESRLAKDRLRRSRQRGVFARDPDRLRLVAVTALFFTLAAESVMLGCRCEALGPGSTKMVTGAARSSTADSGRGVERLIRRGRAALGSAVVGSAVPRNRPVDDFRDFVVLGRRDSRVGAGIRWEQLQRVLVPSRPVLDDHPAGARELREK
jgi:hypothetical protein